MRDYNRNEPERPRLNLVRGADGRLRPADSQSRDGGMGGAQPEPFRPTVAASPDVQPWAAARHQHQHKTDEPAEVPKPVQQVSITGHEQQSGQKKKARFKLPKIRAPRLSLPKLSLPRFKPRKGRYILAAVPVAVVAVLGVSLYSWIGQKEEGAPPQSAQASDVLNVTDAQEPEFDAVFPQGKSIEDLGGWVRVSPADKDPVFAYVDRVGDIQLNISQQQLPENLRVNTGQRVAELAAGFAANEKLVTEDGVEAYLGTSIRGPQSVILTKNGLLILIKSSGKLTNEQWVEYIGLLR